MSHTRPSRQPATCPNCQKQFNRKDNLYGCFAKRTGHLRSCDRDIWGAHHRDKEERRVRDAGPRRKQRQTQLPDSESDAQRPAAKQQREPHSAASAAAAQPQARQAAAQLELAMVEGIPIPPPLDQASGVGMGWLIVRIFEMARNMLWFVIRRLCMYLDCHK